MIKIKGPDKQTFRHDNLWPSCSLSSEKWGKKEDYRIWYAGMLAVAFRQLLGHVSNSENDNTLPIKGSTVLHDTVCYNTSNKDKRRAATETATEWLNSGSSQSSWQQATSDSAYPPTHLTHSHIILPTQIYIPTYVQYCMPFKILISWIPQLQYLK